MKTALLAFITAVSFVSCSTVSQTSVAPITDSVTVRMVTEGIVHRHIKRPSGPWNVHIVSIDLTRPELDVVSARAFDSLKGRETTSSIAARLSRDNQQVLVAVNADFFNMQTGENDLSQIIEGEIVKAVKKPLRAQFGVGYSRTPFIERFAFDGMALGPRGTIPLDAVNTLRDSSIVLLNRFFHQYTRNDSESVFALRTIRTAADTIVAIAFDTLHAGLPVSIGDSIQLLRSTGRDELKVAIGDTVRLLLGFLPKTEKIKTLVGGLPRIVAGGRNIAIADSMPGLTAKFTETRHPRTGVGFSKDRTKLFLVTVDGRQKTSIGMSLMEFADLMVEAGCYKALNFDGGGSTTMVVDGKVVNLPSDAAGERPVANALLVVGKPNAGISR
jgi:hypothetical protein